MANPMGAGLMLAPPFPINQADTIITPTPPGTGVKNLVLQTYNAMIVGIALKVQWTVQPDPLELYVTLDGEEHVFSFANPVSNTYYYPKRESQRAITAYPLSTTDYAIYCPYQFIGRNIKIEAETTGGTVQVLTCRVKWMRYL